MLYSGIISSFCLVLRIIYLFQGLVFILIVENIFGFLIKRLTLSFPQQKLLWKDCVRLYPLLQLRLLVTLWEEVI